MPTGVFFFQAEDGIRDLVRSRGLGDVYKSQVSNNVETLAAFDKAVLVTLAGSMTPALTKSS